MQNELKPCPFCGGEATMDSSGKKYQVWCKRCSCIHMGEFYNTEVEAIAAWNRRTEQESELPASSTPTNAQRIRGMSDEELAMWLVDATVCERVCHEDEYCHGNECVKRVTDWLQQPCGGVEND